MALGKLFGGIDTDAITKVIALVDENKDVLDHLGKLPEMFEKFGSGLDAAGDQARDAARTLMGDDGKSGIRGVLGDASDSLGSIAKALAGGADTLGDAAKGVAKVPMMGGPAETFASAAKQIGATTDQLANLSTAMDSISDMLVKVGSALDKLGDNLGDSGTEVKGFMST